MSKKQKFIEMVDKLLNEMDVDEYSTLDTEALEYFNILKAADINNDKPKFTENGKLVLKYMQENKELRNNIFNAKEVGEGLGVSSRTASGAMRKLVTDGYVEKIGTNPVIYSLTTSGVEVNVDAE
jgi:DNA-binding MarR family transcriptional regulator